MNDKLAKYNPEYFDNYRESKFGKKEWSLDEDSKRLAKYNRGTVESAFKEIVYIMSENMSFPGGEAEGIGFFPLEESNLVRITRFTIYKNKPVTAYLHVWS